MLLLAAPQSLMPFVDRIIRAAAIAVEPTEEADHEMQLRVMMMLSALASEPTICQAIKPVFATVLVDIIKPGAKWSSGRMVERRREAASEFLRRCLKHNCMSKLADDEYMVEAVIESCENGIDDDWNPEMRRCSTTCLAELLSTLGKNQTLSSEVLYKLWPLLSKRLDDILDAVRHAALDALDQYFKYLPDDVSQDHIEEVIKLLMIHLDDPQEPIREHVTAVLTATSEVSPRLLLQECQAARSLHQTPTHCDQLVAAAEAVLAR